MTRIIAGLAKGRRLAVPPGSATRPTADRAREALFSTLHSLRGDLDGAAFLDLFAGSGAIGLEALSRGAAQAVFVEADVRALRTLRANVSASGLEGAVVLAGKVGPRLLAGPGALRTAGKPAFDVAFFDPPYSVPSSELRGLVGDLRKHGWLDLRAHVVVERSSRDEPWSWPAGFQAVSDRRYGEARIWYGRAADGDGQGR